MGLLSKFNFLAGIKSWLVAIIAVLSVVCKLLYDRGERLEEKWERANEKVKAHKKFTENRRKVRDMDIGGPDGITANIRRMFPSRRNRPGPPS